MVRNKRTRGKFFKFQDSRFTGVVKRSNSPPPPPPTPSAKQKWFELNFLHLTDVSWDALEMKRWWIGVTYIPGGQEQSHSPAHQLQAVPDHFHTGWMNHAPWSLFNHFFGWRVPALTRNVEWALFNTGIFYRLATASHIQSRSSVGGFQKKL